REMPNLRNHGNGALVINEVAFDAPGRPGYVELYNRGATPISLAGYSLTNDLRLPKLHTLPALVVPAGGHLQIPTSTLPFGLGTAGGELGIFDGTRVYDPFDAVYFGPHAAGTAYGRYPDGSEDFRAMTPTPGTANAAN
ncbi:MAG: lamin tail domain-containing protein, partial [Myxococcales bacterium]